MNNAVVVVLAATAIGFATMTYLSQRNVLQLAEQVQRHPDWACQQAEQARQPTEKTAPQKAPAPQEQAGAKPDDRELPGLAAVVNADKKKISSLLILTSLSPDLIDKEYLQSDRELSILVRKQMTALCESNGQKLTIISPNKAEEYKSKHSDWKDADPAAIGRHFCVDYVLLVEITSMNMYEPGSARTVYRGRLGADVTLVTVNQPDSDPQACVLNSAYPSEAKAELADADMPTPQFRTKFLTHVAKVITWKFLEHPKHDDSDVD